ncbi:MAG TPA: hypothetical protein VFG69_03095, partial [Nannocystaceae bacterium]|nr:hypothetical protein [Nannocystaceae bacterium]
VLFATYVLAARGAGNLYPFSTFDMYGKTALDSASRIVARDGDELHEIEHYEHWRCEAPPPVDPHACPREWPFVHLESVDRVAIRRIHDADPPGADARPVAVVRRIWRFSGDAAPTIVDCVLASCEASP